MAPESELRASPWQGYSYPGDAPIPSGIPVGFRHTDRSRFWETPKNFKGSFRGSVLRTAPFWKAAHGIPLIKGDYLTPIPLYSRFVMGVLAPFLNFVQ